MNLPTKFKKLRSFKFFWGSLVGILLLLGAIGLAAASLIKQRSVPNFSYKLALEVPNATQGYLKHNQGEAKITVTDTTPKAFSLAKAPTLLLVAQLNDTEIFRTQLETTQEKSEFPPQTFNLDLTKVEEGTHVLKAVVMDATTTDKTVFDTQQLSLRNDKVVPTLVSASTEKGTLIRYSVEKTTAASKSAENGLKITTNSKGPFTVTLSFSEAVSSPTEIATNGGTLASTQQPQATIAATLTAKDSQFKLPIIFTDLVGNAIAGELQYVFDNQPPKLNTIFDHRVDPTTKDNFFVVFSASEPLAFVRGTVNGVTKNASGNYKGYRLEGLPITQEKNLIKITAQDLAGNPATAEIQVTVEPERKSTPFNFSSSQSLPEHVRHCTDEDKKICGYENVSDMSCEEFKVVKDCLAKRCSRDGFYLGDCEG